MGLSMWPTTHGATSTPQPASSCLSNSTRARKRTVAVRTTTTQMGSRTCTGDAHMTRRSIVLLKTLPHRSEKTRFSCAALVGCVAHPRLDAWRLSVPLPRGAARGLGADDGAQHLVIQTTAYPRLCAHRRTVPRLVCRKSHRRHSGRNGKQRSGEGERKAHASCCNARAEAENATRQM